MVKKETQDIDDESDSDGERWHYDALFVILTKCYLYPVTATALIMWVIHTFMALSNSTTFECTKGSHLEYLRGMNAMDLPYSKRIDKNLYFFCFERDAICDILLSKAWSTTVRGRGNEQNLWCPHIWGPPAKVSLYTF